MSWTGWAIAPGAQVSFVPLVRLDIKGEKKNQEFFSAIFNFLELSTSPYGGTNCHVVVVLMWGW